MFCYVYGNFVYVKVPKNGCMTYTTFLSKNGWKEENLFYADFDIENTKFFGHLTEPNSRHTKGLAQYLINTNQTHLLESESNRLLISGVFDEHTYSVNMMIPQLMNKVEWIPLDYSWRHFDGDYLTNRYFKNNSLNLYYDGTTRLNTASDEKKSLYAKINSLKEQYDLEYQKLVKNLLEPDLKVYIETIDKYNSINLDID